MRGLLILLLVLIAVGASVLWNRPDRETSEPEEQPPAANDYMGSEACASCHKDIHDRWRKTAHALTLRDFSADVVAKPFDGEIFTSRDIDHRLGPGGSMHTKGPGGAMRDFDVDIVIGVRRVQMFTTKMEDGRIQVLPVFLEVPKQRWFDYTDFIFGAPQDLSVPPDSANSWYQYARNFNSRCGECHTTNYDIGYDADKGRYDTTWSERAVGCESCHGPGRKHCEDPAQTITNPAKLSIERSNQTCGACHAEAETIVPGFLPGDDLFAFKDVHGLEDTKHLMPDGRANELIHNLVPIMQSKCGPIACTQCHDPHGRGIPGDLFRPLSDDKTCTQCHGEIGSRIEEHTHHKATSEGSRCVNCHMPRLVIEGGHGWTHDHTISIPSIKNTQKLGLPNACGSCHLLEDTGWEYEHLENWWPGLDTRNHRVRLADAFASDDNEKLLGLLKDKNPVYRAGAAWALAGKGADLRPLLLDKHPMVRRAAIKGVAARYPDALLPLLQEPNMVLRRAAAFELAEKRESQPFDYISARPELRRTVHSVLATFLRLRPDVARLHFTLGGLHEVAGRKQEAIGSYERYLRLNPHNTRIRNHVEQLKDR